MPWLARRESKLFNYYGSSGVVCACVRGFPCLEHLGVAGCPRLRPATRPRPRARDTPAPVRMHTRIHARPPLQARLLAREPVCMWMLVFMHVSMCVR